LKEIRTKGFGIYARHKMFVLDDAGRIIPIKNPDKIALDDLIGYERERGIVIDNTLALLDNKNANNVLLYGDAGTGKSSTVKALVNSFYNKGLRLIEFKKNQLEFIPQVIEGLSDNPLKFIFFIDDLTFSSDDNNFSALKATLEGGVCGRGHNILIYATSNHRHMIKESASARQDSVNVADALEETTSLSARFGITITYLKCDRTLFARIVTELADKNGIAMSHDELVVGAEAFALRGGGRNPRTAKQYIDKLGTKR
jgi:predicted AAA+ superfamily ATPase